MLFIPGLVTVLITAQSPGAVLHVGATVAPACRIAVEISSGDRNPSAVVSCAASGLRTLRVTTNHGDRLVPVPARQPRQRAGGAVAFAITRAQDSTITFDF